MYALLRLVYFVFHLLRLYPLIIIIIVVVFVVVVIVVVVVFSLLYFICCCFLQPQSLAFTIGASDP
jgi:hypothetical protein